ncbi:MAG: class I SAM-dependent methyltransferase [Gemmatimonadales bacterium]
MDTRSLIEQTDSPGRSAEHLHRMWASVATSWGEHADYIDARAAELTARMLDLTEPRPGERVLELACGAGGLGLAAAARVAPSGEVVLSDVAAGMTAIASSRAHACGLTNVSTRVLDLEHIEQPDGSFDVVLCRDGLQFALDPGRAAREIRRVLRPGGRAAIAVWGPRERNPWLGVILDAASAQLGRPVPPPGMPGPFALADPAELVRALRAAGLSGVVVSELSVPLRTASVDEWWTRTTALAGPLATILAQLPHDAVQALRAHAQEAIEPYTTPTGCDFPGVALIIRMS